MQETGPSPRFGLSRRTLIGGALSGAGLIMLGGVIQPEEAFAVGGTLTCSDTTCSDPTNWQANRYFDHAGYPAWSGKYDSQGNKIGTERDCTNYVAWRLMFNGMPESQVPRLGGAGQWAASARSKGITVNSTPAVGAVAQWSVHDYHVAWVEAVYGDGTILISESDWPGANHWVDYRHLATSEVENFIHIQDGATAPALTPLESKMMVVGLSSIGQSYVIFEDGRIRNNQSVDPRQVELAVYWAHQSDVYWYNDDDFARVLWIHGLQNELSVATVKTWPAAHVYLPSWMNVPRVATL